MTPKINTSRTCSNCGSKKTYVNKSINSQQWYHTTEGGLLCKQCRNLDYYHSKLKIKDGFQNNFIRVTSYNEVRTGNSGDSFKKRKITWD